jgi:hypothetical protein
MFEGTFYALRVLIAICAGIHQANQAALCATEILSIINRLVETCDYTQDDIDEMSAGKFNLKRKFNGQVSRLVVTILDGEPHHTVILATLNGLSWETWGAHLDSLKSIMETGSVVDKSDLLIPRKKTLKDGAVLDGTALAAEAYKFMTVVDKLSYASKELPDDDLDEMLLAPMDNHTLQYFTERLGEVEIIRFGQLERMFFWMPKMYMHKGQRSETNEKTKLFMDKCPRESDEGKLEAFVDRTMEQVSSMMQEERVSSRKLVRLNNFLKDLSPGDSVLFISLVSTIVCLFAFDDTSTHQSLMPTTYGRLPELYPVFMALATLHLFVCMLAFYSFTAVRVPVLLAMQKRGQMNKHRRTEDKHHHSDTVAFLSQTVHLYGFGQHMAHERLLKTTLSHYGVISSARVVNVAGETNSWAIVSFSHRKAVDKIQTAMDKGGELALKERFITATVQKKTVKMYVRETTEEYIDSVGGAVQKLVEDIEYELAARDTTPGYYIASLLERIASTARVLPKMPILSMYLLRYNPQLWEAVFDIMFSCLGFYSSPLYLSYHLIRFTKLEGAKIVLRSIAQNWLRLLTTMVLALLMMYYFAISGVLFYKADHTDSDLVTANKNGPCANLLTCFMSYSKVGLTQVGVEGLMNTPSFPERWNELGRSDTGRQLWEIAFMMGTSCIVISIITGIICDTFGELRAEQDNARLYRSSNCFITGIPFSTVPPEKSTNYLQYMFLLLFLAKKNELQQDLTPQEDYVWYAVNHGRIDWCGWCKIEFPYS